VRQMLSAERVVLNFLSHLSGIATLVRTYVDCAATHGTGPGKPAICDTRKTTPGFRVLEKYAVRCGGGVNHRMALFDGVMLKDNHLAALAQRFPAPMPLAEVVQHVRRALPQNMPMWLEIESLDQLADAVAGGPDFILLDNMSAKEVRRAVQERDRLSTDKRPLLEASGGITLENLPDYARTGVDRISIGALTHSAPILDIGLDMDTGQP
jgi:nicotinate-nucleotide pyrophosphorylase (carboxylating)